MSVFLLLTNKIQIQTKSRSPLENPEIQSKIRNPRKNPVDFEISYAMCGELPSKSQNYGVRYLEVISLTVL